jgi:hypothetical protein
MLGHIIIIAANATCIFIPKFKNIILYKEMIKDIGEVHSSTWIIMFQFSWNSSEIR